MAFLNLKLVSNNNLLRIYNDFLIRKLLVYTMKNLKNMIILHIKFVFLS